MFFVFFERPAFDVELMTVSIQVLKGKSGNQSKTACFTGKMKIITWECDIYPFLGKHWAFLDLFQSHGKNVLTKKGCIHVFSKKITKVSYIFGKNVRNNCCRNIGIFQQLSRKHLPFPHEALV